MEEEIVSSIPSEFDTSYFQMKGDVDRGIQTAYYPTERGKLDGGNPYGDPPYDASRSYQQGQFFDQRYIDGYNRLMESLQQSKMQQAVPQSEVPQGEA